MDTVISIVFALAVFVVGALMFLQRIAQRWWGIFYERHNPPLSLLLVFQACMFAVLSVQSALLWRESGLLLVYKVLSSLGALFVLCLVSETAAVILRKRNASNEPVEKSSSALR